MSEDSPTLRTNNSVDSRTGVRISSNPYSAKTSRATASTRFHTRVSGGRRSRVPLTLAIIAGPRGPWASRAAKGRVHVRPALRLVAEVFGLVFEVVLPVRLEALDLIRREVALVLRGVTGPERGRRDHRAGQDDRAGRDEGARADVGIVEDGRVHADERAPADRACMHDGVVAERDLLLEREGSPPARDVERAVVLHVRARADPDGTAVAADDRRVPDRHVVAEDDVSDDSRGLGDEDALAEPRGSAAIRPDRHGKGTIPKRRGAEIRRLHT